MLQLDLFGQEDAPTRTGLPAGAVYEPRFLTAEEEAGLLALIGGLALVPAQYKGFTARRKVLSFGGSFDYDAHRLRAAEPVLDALLPLRARVARWLAVEPQALAHALVAEYAPGTPLGWHRDVPEFELVAGVSLGADAELRFRPWPPDQPRRRDILRLHLEPRSIYRLGGPARWAWQHSIAPVQTLRWSITFRTLRTR